MRPLLPGVTVMKVVPVVNIPDPPRLPVNMVPAGISGGGGGGGGESGGGGGGGVRITTGDVV